MRNNEKKGTVISLVVLLFALFNIFSRNIFKANSMPYIILWAICFVISVIAFGFHKDRTLNKIDILQMIAIYCTSYVIVCYLCGIFIQYIRTPYSLKILSIIKNVVPLIILIILQELYRYNLVKNSPNLITKTLIVAAFSIFNITIGIDLYDSSTVEGVFMIIGYLILPSIIINSLLTFITDKTGYEETILYRLLTEVYIYIVPILPDFGIYVQSVLNIIFPAFVFLKFNTLFYKERIIARKPKHSFLSKLMTVPLLAILLAVVSLISGLFTYIALAIGSNLMIPTFAKGDMVIIKKVKNVNEIKVGNIVAYHNEGKTVVHRAVKIYKLNGSWTLHTKGDANNSIDAVDIKKENIVGVVKYEIKYLGYPSIWLKESFKGK